MNLDWDELRGDQRELILRHALVHDRSPERESESTIPVAETVARIKKRWADARSSTG